MKRILSLLIPLCLSASLSAMAAEGYVAADVSLNAGPDSQYPQIVELSAGSPIQIVDCIDGWTWCDVIAGDNRGWVPGTYLQEVYGNQRVIVTDYGPRIGIPIVAFSLGAYWDEHYRGRPWYAQRTQWQTRAIRPSAPPRLNINIHDTVNVHDKDKVNVNVHDTTRPADHRVAPAIKPKAPVEDRAAMKDDRRPKDQVAKEQPKSASDKDDRGRKNDSSKDDQKDH